MRDRVAGKLERLAYARSQREHELARGGHPRGYRYDARAGDFVVAWIEKFGRHSKGEWAGKPLLLEEWQKFILREAFGWKRPDGTRRYRKLWVEIPRKNAKTTLAAAIGLYLLVADNEAGGEVYTTATKREQALICHTAARSMARASKDLQGVIRIPKAAHANLVCEALGAKMQPLASDYGTLDGLNPHGDIRDEVHAWTDHGLAEVLDTATGARRQPMTLEITTAGVWDPESVGWTHHDYACNVLEGSLEDDRLFAFVTSIDEGDDPWDPASWAKASPNLGISLKRAYVADEAGKAKRQPSYQNAFLRLLLNRWTQQATRWLDAERWREAEDPSFTEADLEGRECVGGLDLSLRNDVSALVLAFRRPDDGFDLTCRFWLPESTVEDEARKGRTYWRTWAEQGWLDLVPGDTIRHSFIRDEIRALVPRFSITEFGFDPAHANLLAGELSDDGHKMVEVRQGPITMSEPSKLFEALVYSKMVRATGRPGGPNPIFRWMLGNAVAHVGRTGLIQPDKFKARGKIDGVVAAITALSRVVGGGSVGDYQGDALTFV